MNTITEQPFVTGKKAKDILNKILNKPRPQKEADSTGLLYYGPYEYGYYKNDDKWIAFDNRTCDCWTKDFPTKEKAIRWLRGEDD